MGLAVPQHKQEDKCRGVDGLGWHTLDEMSQKS